MDKYRPNFFLFKYNEQLVFGRYLFNRAYATPNLSEEFRQEGDACRQILRYSLFVGAVFTCASFALILMERINLN